MSIGCAGKLATPGTCLVPLSSCTKAHALSSDGNVFRLLPTDFATWTRNWKQMCLGGGGGGGGVKKSVVHTINNLIFIFSEKPNKALKFIATQAMVYFLF